MPSPPTDGVVNINIGGTIVTATVRGTFNAALAQQIATALDTASINGTLSYATYTGSGGLPTVASGSTQEVILPPTLSGSVTIPAASAGVQQILAATNTAPITIQGSPNLQIIGAGPGNVSIIDPASIVLLDNGSTTFADAVTVTSADSPYTVGMRAGNETIVGYAGGTISGGALKNLINVSQSTGSNVIISEGSGGDTVFTGAGATTIEATSSSHGGTYVDGAGSFDVNDQGTADTILATAAATASVSTGGSQALVFGGADSLGVLVTGSANTVSAANSAASVTAAVGSNGLMLFGGTGTLNYLDGGQSDTLAAGTGAASVVASGSAPLIFGTFGSATGSLAVSLGGKAATVSAGNSNTAASTSGNSALVFGSFSTNAGSLTGLDSGVGTTVSGGASNAAITLNGSNALVFGGFKSQVATPGTLSVLDQGSNDTVSAGNAATTVTATIGSKGLFVFGGSNTLTFVNSSAATMVGAAGGAITYTGNSGGLFYAAGSGAETMNAGSSTTSNVVFAGNDAKGADIITAGQGNDTLVAGKAAATLAGGGNADQYFFVQSLTGGAGNADVITNFSTLNGSVALFGYGQSAAAIVATASTVAGNTTLTLSDSTRITFLNVSNASAIHLTSA